MRFYIIRHADPDYQNDTITEKGHREADVLAKRLAMEGITRIYSSPLGRALDTMRYTRDLLGLEPVVEEWTAELSEWRLDQAPWGTLAAWNIPGEIIRAQQEHPTRDNWHLSPPFDTARLHEEFAAVVRNSDAFTVRHGYERHDGRYRILEANHECIAVFCHGGFGLTWLAQLLEIPLPLMWSGFWLPPSSVTTVLFDERSREWAVPRCIGLGDVSHLYAAGLPVQPRGILANFE